VPTETATVDTRLLGRDVTYSFDGPWGAYWMVLLRVIAGWWFLNAGLGKVIEQGVTYDTTGWLEMGTQGSVLHPMFEWFAVNAAIVPNFMVPWGQIAIGLGLIFGVLTRLAAANGMLLGTFFYLGNAGWGHGFVTSELFGILIFGTILVIGAGRVFGGDAYLENLELVEQHPRLRYLMG
jgi:thiosulfate dehydrogenase [quinone] large subunit